jgi:hypothetical protein
MLDHGLMKDVTVAPRPPVIGMAVEKVQVSLSALDIKGAFATAQDGDQAGGASGVRGKLEMGNANHRIGYVEFANALALCGHIRYAECKGSSMADRVAGILDNYLGKRNERDVLSDVLYPPPPRTQIAQTAGPMPGQALETHQLFVNTWKEAMKGCLQIDVIGFPTYPRSGSNHGRVPLAALMRVPCSSPHPPWDPTPRVDRWEEAVFLIVQENFEELSAVFSFYAQSIAGGSLQATTLLAVTLQDNELASFCRDTGLLNEHFTIARVQALYKDVSHAFSAGSAGGVYSEGIHMPAFLVLLLQMALNRSNPKLVRANDDASSLDHPLPECFEAMLEKHVLKRAKRSRMAELKTKLLSADPKALFAPARGALEAAFNAAVKKREKLPAVTLFAKVVMSRSTLVAELKERGLIVQKSVKAKPKVTGADAAEVELSLAPIDVESAFTLCQDGEHGDAANDS